MAEGCAAEGGIAIGSGMRLSKGSDDGAIFAIQTIKRTLISAKIIE